MPQPLDTKPYRPPGQQSGPDVGCVYAFGIMFVAVLVIAVLVRIFWR